MQVLNAVNINYLTFLNGNDIICEIVLFFFFIFVKYPDACVEDLVSCLEGSLVCRIKKKKGSQNLNNLLQLCQHYSVNHFCFVI